MPAMIVFEGKETKKRFSGTTTEFVPFVGLNQVAGRMVPGIGIYDPLSDKGCFWGCGNELFSVLRAWRAVRFLEHMDVLVSGSFSDCWEAANRDLELADSRSWGRIEAQIGSEFYPLRDKIMNSVPAEEELCLLYNAILNNGIGIDEDEIVTGMDFGLLPDDFLLKAYAEKELA